MYFCYKSGRLFEHCGLTLSGDIEIDSEMEWEARAPRKAIMLVATLTDSNGTAHRVRVRNLSATGLGGVIEAPLAMNDVVRIDLPGMPSVTAIVIRRSDKEFGVRFYDEIAPELVSVKIENEGSHFAIRDLHKTVQDCRRPGVLKG